MSHLVHNTERIRVNSLEESKMAPIDFENRVRLTFS